MLVESGAKLLPCLRQALLQCKCLKRQRIPFLLKDTEKGRYRGQCRRPRSDNTLGLEFDQIFDGQGFAIYWFNAIFRDVGFDEALFVHSACQLVSYVSIGIGYWAVHTTFARCNRDLRRLAGDC